MKQIMRKYGIVGKYFAKGKKYTKTNSFIFLKKETNKQRNSYQNIYYLLTIYVLPGLLITNNSQYGIVV